MLQETQRLQRQRMLCAVVSPAMGHWGTCPPRLQQFHF